MDIAEKGTSNATGPADDNMVDSTDASDVMEIGTDDSFRSVNFTIDEAFDDMNFKIFGTTEDLEQLLNNFYYVYGLESLGMRSPESDTAFQRWRLVKMIRFVQLAYDREKAKSVEPNKLSRTECHIANCLEHRPLDHLFLLCCFIALTHRLSWGCLFVGICLYSHHGVFCSYLLGSASIRIMASSAPSIDERIFVIDDVRYLLLCTTCKRTVKPSPRPDDHLVDRHPALPAIHRIAVREALLWQLSLDNYLSSKHPE